MTTEIVNFGRNVRFTPAAFYQPSGETEVLEILQQHDTGQIRVVASGHAWSDGICSADAVIDVGRIDHVRVVRNGRQTSVVVGAGCQIRHLLKELNRQELTLPSIGLISEQTIAGATATGTHGSGKNSLSHYLTRVRIACFAGDQGQPVIRDLCEGDELRAARCSLGCLGVVVEVELPCVPQYFVSEQTVACDTIDQALAFEEQTPLQQFFLFPHKWSYYVTRRAVADVDRPGLSAPLYRIYWFLCIDLGLHLGVKLAAAWLRSRALVRLLCRRLIPVAIFPWWRVIDRSDRILVMEHELFRHLELEVFVPDTCVKAAADFVATVLKQADGVAADVSPDIQDQLEDAGLWQDFVALRGRFTHHYPVCFRRILRDDTLISMASGDHEAWYSISFITYVEPRDDFFAMAAFLAKSMSRLFEARIHWGKWFPLGAESIEAAYKELPRFRALARQHDPNGVFVNSFTADVRGESQDQFAGC